MRDSKTSFSPVVVKQEPRDPTEQDLSTTTTTTNNNNGCNNKSHLTQALAVDLRSTPSQRESGMLSRSRATPGSSECLPGTYESTEDFVAQIARRVREESSLRGLELTPVTGLGPLADLKTSAITPIFSGPSSVENGGKSRGEYACAECSSRFDTARDYRAHCLTHQVLKAESMLRSSRGGSRERGERRGDGGGGDAGDSPVAVFGGLGLGSGGGGVGTSEAVVSFTCEDCNTRFSSRDTYAMHMLIRAKNEACFPARSLPHSSSTTTTTLHPTTPTTPKTNTDATNADSNHSTNMPPLSPTPLSLPGSALLLSAITPPELKLEGVGKSEVGRKSVGGGRGVGEGVRQSLSDNTPHHSFIHSLGLDLSHVSDSYNAAWWSKYVPWMAGMAGMAGVGVGLPEGGSEGGGGGAGEGPALPMVCYLCGELFTNRDALAMHVLFHTRDMPTSLPDSTSGVWKKSFPALPSSSSSSSPGTGLTPSSSSTSTLILGHAAALRQLQQQRSGHYNSIGGPSAADLGPPRLSPTEAAVASAAAAAVAAVTPPHHHHPPLPTASQASSKSTESADTPLFVNGVRGARGNDSYDRMSSSGRSSVQDFSDKFHTTGGRAVELGQHLNHLSPPQRGASAPIPTTATTSSSPSPLLPVAGVKSPFRSSLDPTKPLANVRPLSADHVVLRQHRTLMTRPVTHADRRHSDDVTTSTADWNKASSAKNEASVGWRNGSDMQHHSAFNVYRLQRLKKLRLAKGAYRRPGTRGRPPMTIYGTAGQRPMGGHAPGLTPTLPVSTSSDRVSPGVAPPPPSSSSSSPSASKISSMVQLLTSQGHAVSACSHCELVFGDRTLYQLHMGLHNVNNPWQCNACGCVCSNRLHFATHTLHY